MPVNSDLTEAQVREFGSGPGGQRAATQGAKLRKRVVDLREASRSGRRQHRHRKHFQQDTARDSPRAGFVAARSTASRRGIEPCRDPSSYRTVSSDLPGPAVNIAEFYARFAEDMRNGTHDCPGFDHAVTRHELIEAVAESAATGRRVSVSSIRGRRP